MAPPWAIESEDLMNFKALCAGALLAASLGGCALFGGDSNLTPAQQIDAVKTIALPLAKSTFDGICASQTAPAVCRNPVDRGKIDAVYKSAVDALGAAEDALNAKDGDPAALQKALGDLATAIADYQADVEAFRQGKAPPK
jgi:hypothetical protein